MPAIPPPELIGEDLSAALFRLDDRVVLVLPPVDALPGGEALRPLGPLVIRYALPYLHREAALIPGLFASEYGAFMTGREAWDFALHHANLHPRADLLGLRTDGTRDQVMLRDLDFGRGVEVWAYAGPEATLPVARLDGWWSPSAAPDLPPLLAQYLPRLALD